MSNLVEERSDLEIEDCQYRAAVSENFAFKLGASVNFINRRQVDQHRANANGAYNVVSSDTNVDGLISFPYPFEIVELQIWSGSVVPTTGQIEFDIQWRTQNTGSYASICSTKPKFDSTAIVLGSCGIGQTATGFTAPVLTKTQFAANDQIIVNYTTNATGPVNGAGIIIFHRPI